MENIKIQIDKLGRIVNSQVIIDRLMLFCGNSGMGKSYVAMICHYFFYVWLYPVRINQFFKDKGLDYETLRPEMRGSGKALEINKTDLEEWLAADALRFLSYLLNVELIDSHIHITLPSTIPDVITINFEETIEGLVNEEETYLILFSDHLKYRVRDKGINEESPFSVLLRFEMMQCIFGNHRALSNYFILPPSRGAILTEKIIPQSGLFKKFEESLTRLRTMDYISNNDTAQAYDVLSKLMDGKIGQEKDSFFYENSKVHLPLTAAASSIREIGVLQLLLEKTSLSNDAILIEEPEAHLHPLKQRFMADVLGSFFNAGAYMQITTHSDYFLQRFNELLLLGNLQRKINTEEYVNYCQQLNENPESAIINDSIRAYILEENNEGQSVIRSLSLDDGVPFTSFRDVILLSLQKQDKLNKILSNDN